MDDYPDERPKTRGECLAMARPCPFLSCRHHLAVDGYRKDGRLSLTILRDDPENMDETCALDVADAGEIDSTREIASLLNLKSHSVVADIIARRKLPDDLRAEVSTMSSPASYWDMLELNDSYFPEQRQRTARTAKS